MEVGTSARDPWQRTFDAANGAHVIADAPSKGDLKDVGGLPGIAERDLPIPFASARATTPAGDVEPLQIAGLPPQARINMPLRTAGSRPRAGGIVLERSFAEALGVGVGNTLRIPGRDGPIELPVIGTAISASQPRYPHATPGLAWVPRSALARIEPDRSRWDWSQAIRLSDPAAAPTFAMRVSAPPATGNVFVRTWQQQRAQALRDARPIAIILTTYAIVLLLVVFAVVAILVGARATQQHREIGLLKAIGLTPRQVTAVFTIESAALGLIAVVIGFVAGALLAPRLAAPSAVTLLASPTVAASPWHLVVAACPVLLVLVASTRASVRRTTRFTVLHAIQSGAAPPASGSRLARAIGASVLPLGLKDLAVRRQRAFGLAAAIAVSGAAIVFALSIHATLDAQTAMPGSAVPRELPLLVYTLDAVLLLITATTLVAVALLSVRERIRDYAVLKTVGLTPRQIASSLVGAHTALGLIAALLSIPVGIALYLAVYRVAGADAEDLVLAPWWSLALVAIGTLALVAAATSLPAHLATRIPTADALRYE